MIDDLVAQLETGGDFDLFASLDTDLDINAVELASTEAGGFKRVPKADEIKLTPGAAYVHMTSNNTIEGTECKTLPDVGDVPLVSDTSSDMFSRPIDVSRHALIYAGAQLLHRLHIVGLSCDVVNLRWITAQIVEFFGRPRVVAFQNRRSLRI